WVTQTFYFYMNLILIAIGGAIGSVTRYIFGEVIFRLIKSAHFFTSFPWSTFLVNAVGSLLAGVLYYFVIKNFENFDPKLKNFLLVGFLGGFTTFSAFCLDFFRLATAGQHLQAFVYVLASVTISILALFFGFYATKLIFS
ncbi:MAG: fluoride efflux transporter CrcB, partial [Rickettsiales bacterium]|nr:fluoride efflux transporter CrcB [Rickettsiales bacterium]